MAMAQPIDSLSFVRNCLLVCPSCTAVVKDAFTQNYSQLILTSNGIGDVRAFRVFLQDYPLLFVLNKHDNKEFVSLTTRLTLCPAHSRKSGSCKKNACESLHICFFHLLSGKCSYGTRCRFGHSLESPQNERVLKAHHLGDLNVDELRMIFTLPFVRRGVTLPLVCRSYNEESGCDKAGGGRRCLSIHLCKHYVKNDCSFGNRCRRNHDINDQVKEALARYGVSVSRKPREIVHDLLMYTQSEDKYDLNTYHKKWLASEQCGGGLSQLPLPMAGQICTYFRNGRCKFGSSCRNIHEQPSIQQSSCDVSRPSVPLKSQRSLDYGLLAEARLSPTRLTTADKTPPSGSKSKRWESGPNKSCTRQAEIKTSLQVLQGDPVSYSAVKQRKSRSCELHRDSEVIDMDKEPTEKGRAETLTPLTVSCSSQPRIKSSPQLHGSKATRSTLPLQTDEVFTPASKQHSSEAERRQAAAAEIKPWQQDRDNVSDNDDTRDEWEMYSSGSSASSTSSYVSMELTDPLTTADADSPLCSYPSRSSRADTDLSRPSDVATINRHHSVDSDNTDTLPSSKRSSGGRRPPLAHAQACAGQLRPPPARGPSRTELRHTLKAKVADEDPRNTLAVDLEKFAADSHEVKDIPSPIFSKSWQAVFSVCTAGGTLRKPGSDVIIEVPAGAVDNGVAVHTAVCTDTDRVARVLGLQGGESVFSPLAEYWAGHDFRFQKPVRITLPHFLPPNPDPRLVSVYRLTGRPDGHIAISRLRQQPASGTHTTQSRDPQNYDVTLSHSRIDHTGHPDSKYHTGHLNTAVQAWYLLSEHQTGHPNAEELREDTASFQLTSDGSFYITTDSFSGYVCTYCGDRGPPVLNMLASGGYTSGAGGLQTAQISVHVWDGRLHISDFKQDCAIAVQSNIQSSDVLDVMPALPDSRLHIKFRIGRLGIEDWQLSLDNTDQPMTPAQRLPNHSSTKIDTTTNAESNSHTSPQHSTPAHTVGQFTCNSYADSQPASVLPQEANGAPGHQKGGHYTLKQKASGCAPQCDGAAGDGLRSSPSSSEGGVAAQQKEHMTEYFQRQGFNFSGLAQMGMHNAGHNDSVHPMESLQQGASLYPPVFPMNSKGQGHGDGGEHRGTVNCSNPDSAAMGHVGGASPPVVLVQNNYYFNPVSTHNNNVGTVQGEYNVAATLNSHRLVKHSAKNPALQENKRFALEEHNGEDVEMEANNDENISGTEQLL